jgi:hypothetical protein
MYSHEILRWVQTQYVNIIWHKRIACVQTDATHFYPKQLICAVKPDVKVNILGEINCKSYLLPTSNVHNFNSCLRIKWTIFHKIFLKRLLGLPTDFTLVFCPAYSNLQTRAIYSSETSVEFHWTTQRYISEDSTLHNHRCENLKSYIILTFTSTSTWNVIEIVISSKYSNFFSGSKNRVIFRGWPSLTLYIRMLEGALSEYWLGHWVKRLRYFMVFFSLSVKL